jgi:hypothetical protein
MAEKNQKVLFQVDLLLFVIHNTQREGSLDLGDHWPGRAGGWLGNGMVLAGFSTGNLIEGAG